MSASPGAASDAGDLSGRGGNCLGGVISPAARNRTTAPAVPSRVRAAGVHRYAAAVTTTDQLRVRRSGPRFRKACPYLRFPEVHRLRIHQLHGPEPRMVVGDEDVVLVGLRSPDHRRIRDEALRILRPEDRDLTPLAVEVAPEFAGKCPPPAGRRFSSRCKRMSSSIHRLWVPASGLGEGEWNNLRNVSNIDTLDR